MTGGKRTGSGRRAVIIDPAEVERLCTLQCTHEELAAWFKVSVRTIERRAKQPAFAQAMAQGKARGRTSVRRQLFGLAAKGNVAAAIFLAKNILGYRDVVANEHSGPEGAAIAIHARPDFSQFSDEELQQLRVLVGKAQPSGRD